jgi:hypothetical protein
MPRNPQFSRRHAWVLCLAFAGSALAADRDAPATMTRDEYRTTEDRIDARHKTDSNACDDLRTYDRDICDAKADGREKVDKAELDARNKPGTEATAKVKKVRADAAYDVAKERCQDLRGSYKGDCRKDAKVVHDRTKSQARFDKGRAKTAAKRATARAAAAQPAPR